MRILLFINCIRKPGFTGFVPLLLEQFCPVKVQVVLTLRTVIACACCIQQAGKNVSQIQTCAVLVAGSG